MEAAENHESMRPPKLSDLGASPAAPLSALAISGSVSAFAEASRRTVLRRDRTISGSRLRPRCCLIPLSESAASFCQRDDWDLLTPKSLNWVTGRDSILPLPPGSRSPRSFISESNSPALISARILISVACSSAPVCMVALGLTIFGDQKGSARPPSLGALFRSTSRKPPLM